MKQAIGDLWTFPADAIVITTNGIIKRDGSNVMGAGVALEARRRHPHIAYTLAEYIHQHGNRPFNLGIYAGKRLISLPTKNHWQDRSDPTLILHGIELLVAIADKFGPQRIVMTRPGCGNGGLDWEDIEPMIEPYLDDRFTVITKE